jgi:putative redox protein
VDCEKPTAKIDRIDKTLAFIGPLDEAQRSRLVEIAGQCPVHRTLTSKIEIHTALEATSATAATAQ